jgi:cell wall-associated NlpC family hydrolase
VPPQPPTIVADARQAHPPPLVTGDLLLFGEGDSQPRITHVGLSLGGWKMVHSSRGNNGVYVDDLQDKKALMDIYISAGSYLR